MEYEKNPDGTDKLDENGNPIPVTVADDKDKEAAKVIAQLTEEIKQERVKRSVAETLLEENKKNALPTPPKELTDEEKLEAIVDKRLKDIAASNAQANKKAAFEKFVTDNKEFHPDNDPTGLKREALQSKFNQFNTDGLTTIDEFIAVIGDAKKLLLGNDTQVDTSRGNNPPSLPTPGNNPPARKVEELTPKELKLAQMPGQTKEKILKLKLKNPEYLATLLEYVRD